MALGGMKNAEDFFRISVSKQKLLVSITSHRKICQPAGTLDLCLDEIKALTGYTGRYKAVLRRAVLRIEEEVMVVESRQPESGERTIGKIVITR